MYNTRISVTIAPELLKALKEYRISRSEALRVGAALMLADLGVIPYDNKLNLFRKMRTYQKELTEVLNKNAIQEEKA